MSQSPSLRGSGRFTLVEVSDAASAAGLNPLHCGAVVASRTAIPRSTLSSSSLNPLHCGAVVASGCEKQPVRRFHQVSIPFIAGQWSLRDVDHRAVGRKVVSIPFIAGQWSLHATGVHGSAARPRSLNPLHCGAVVASRPRQRSAPEEDKMSQSPSLRGSGRF